MISQYYSTFTAKRTNHQQLIIFSINIFDTTSFFWVPRMQKILYDIIWKWYDMKITYWTFVPQDMVFVQNPHHKIFFQLTHILIGFSKYYFRVSLSKISIWYDIDIDLICNNMWHIICIKLIYQIKSFVLHGKITII